MSGPGGVGNRQPVVSTPCYPTSQLLRNPCYICVVSICCLTQVSCCPVPGQTSISFRTLPSSVLYDYVDYHCCNVRPDATPAELSGAVAAHFTAMELDEDEVIGGFLRGIDGDKE